MMDMKGGVFSLSGRTLVVCSERNLLDLVALELREVGIVDLALELEMPKKVTPAVANVIYLTVESDLPFAQLPSDGGMEHFRLKKVEHEGRRYWVIVSPSPRGRYYGFMEFLGGRDEAADGPAFERRGVVEGFYGPLWSWDDRAKMIEFMADLKMNLYIYAPKDDPLHREKWREGYDKEVMAQFSSLTRMAESRYVDFCYALSPGLSVNYSDDADLDATFKKLRQFHEIGVKTFALFLDDIPSRLETTGDRERFGSLGEAQRSFVAKLLGRLKDLDKCIELIFCPTQYHGVERTSYHDEISKLPDEIPIFWTGPQICSKEIRSADSDRMMKAFGRKVLIWDNYPVNDYDRKRMHVNALRNRDPDLPATCLGMLSNPMSEVEASKVAIFTYGEYLWNPRAYDPDRSLERALTYVFGAEALPLARVFVDSLVDFFFDEDDGRNGWMTEALDGGDDIDLERALSRFEEMSNVEELRCIVENEKLLEELDGHIRKISSIGKLGQLHIQAELLMRRIGRNPAKVFSGKVLKQLMG